VSIGQEHYCTAITQLAIAQMYPRFLHEGGGPRVVATCPAGELHELGARMVSDFFEMDGWDSVYLGASLPVAGVIDVLRQRRPVVLCVSVTMTFNLREAEQLILALRSEPELSATKVLVGGRPCQVAQDLWHRLGADATAASAQEAVARGRELLGFPATALPSA
jgi:methanogenic corrinoid protein MtbC1